MFKVLGVILAGFICYMACTKLPMPIEEKEQLLKTKQTDTTQVIDSAGGDINITIDTTTNTIEHFIKL